MATVTEQPNQTFTLTLTDKERKATVRVGVESSPVRPPANVLQDMITACLDGWLRDHLAADGPTRLTRFAALPLAKQERIDAIMTGGS